MHGTFSVVNNIIQFRVYITGIITVVVFAGRSVSRLLSTHLQLTFRLSLRERITHLNLFCDS